MRRNYGFEAVTDVLMQISQAVEGYDQGYSGSCGGQAGPECGQEVGVEGLKASQEAGSSDRKWVLKTWRVSEGRL